MVYFIVFILLLICIYAYDYRRHSRGNLVAYCILCLMFIAIAALRYRIGNDSIIYENIYRYFPTIGELPSYNFDTLRFEPGYIVFSSIPRTFSSDFTYFQIFHAFVVNPIIFWFVYKNTKNKYIGITLFYVCLFLNLNTEVLREALAVCCFLLAWPFYKKGNWVIYYLFIALACTFHISSLILVFLPIFAIPGLRYCFRLGIQVLFIGVVVFAVCIFLQRKFFFILQEVATNESIMERAETYSKSSLGSLRLNIFGMLDQLIKSVLIPLAALWYMKRKYKSEENDFYTLRWLRRMEIIIITGVYFAIAAMSIPIAGRFNNYVALFNFVMISSCFFTTVRISHRRWRIGGIYWSAILAFIICINARLYFVNTHGSSSKKVYMVYYPYESRIDPKENPDREDIFRLYKHFR